MIWVITGLFYGLFMSFYTAINQNNKINGYVLGLWRGFGVSFVSIPVLLIEPFFFDPLYFFLLIIQGILIGYYDSRIFFSSARFGAAGTSRILVFSILISLILYWGTHPSSFIHISRHPLILIGILLSILGIIISYMLMLKEKFTRDLIRFMLPAVFVLSLMSSLTQEIMQRHSLRYGMVYYLFFSTFVSGLYNLFYYLKTEKPTKEQALQQIFSPKVMNIGFLLVFFSSLLIVTKSIALDKTPNTAYVNALSLTSPLWLMLYNHIIRHQDFASPKAGFFMIVCLLILVLFSSF